jgi:hypothetical protein
MMQLWPLGHVEASTQSAASKQPAVNVAGTPQPGTSQRQLAPVSQLVGSVRELHGCKGQLGRKTCQVPLAEHCATGVQVPTPMLHRSVQHGSQGLPSTGTCVGHRQDDGGVSTVHAPAEQVAVLTPPHPCRG